MKKVKNSITQEMGNFQHFLLLVSHYREDPNKIRHKKESPISSVIRRKIKTQPKTLGGNFVQIFPLFFLCIVFVLAGQNKSFSEICPSYIILVAES